MEDVKKMRKSFVYAFHESVTFPALTFMKQLLGSITWWSAVHHFTWSVKKWGKCGWKFIYALMWHMTVIEISMCWTAVSKQLLLHQFLWKSDKPVSCYRQRDWWMFVVST